MAYQLIVGNKRYSSWSIRAFLAMEMTGAPYQEVLVKLYQPDTRQKLLEYSPAAKVPVLTTEHGAIADSLAIAEYLAEQFPERHLWPRDIAARAQARSACAQMHSGFAGLRTHLSCDVQHDEALEAIPAEAQTDIQRMLQLWAECRAAATAPGPYLFGELSLADAFFAPVAVRLRTFRVPLPAVDQAYVDTIYQWPAFQAWLKAGLEEK